MLSIAIIAITDSSEKTAEILKTLYPGKAELFRPGKGELQTLVKEIFHHYEGLVFIMASGIVIRMIAPLISDKYNDPAVVTVDDARRYAISTLSGHEGGANWLSWKVASLLDCEPVITTASDTNRDLILGIGCRRGIDGETVRNELLRVLKEQSVDRSRIRCAASLSVKKDEEGLLWAMDELNIPILFVPLDELRSLEYKEASTSPITMKHFDIPGVCEPCALYIARRGKIIMKKQKYRGVTIALVKEQLCPEH